MEGSPFTGLDVDPAWYAEVQGVHRDGWGSTVVQSYIGAATHRHKPCLHILNRVTLNWIRIQIRRPIRESFLREIVGGHHVTNHNSHV